MTQKNSNFIESLKNIFKSDRKHTLKEAELELAKLKLQLKEAEYDVLEAELQVRNTRVELKQILINQ